MFTHPYTPVQCIYLITAVLQAVTEVTVRQGSNDGELHVTWQLLSVNVTGYAIR